MGTRTDAALARVVAARADLAEEVDRLEAAGRAAVDIPAKIKRSPAKAAAIAGGGAFLVLGGPKRVFRKARKAVTGREEAPLPKSLLPKDIEKSLKKIGTDGDQVRGTIERDFAKYLDDRAKERKKEGIQAAVAGLALTALRADRHPGRPPGRRADVRPECARVPGAAPEDPRATGDGRGGGEGRRGATSRSGERRRSSERVAARLATGEWRNGRRAGLRSRCRVSGVWVRVPRARSAKNVGAPTTADEHGYGRLVGGQRPERCPHQVLDVAVVAVDALGPGVDQLAFALVRQPPRLAPFVERGHLRGRVSGSARRAPRGRRRSPRSVVEAPQGGREHLAGEIGRAREVVRP